MALYPKCHPLQDVPSNSSVKPQSRNDNTSSGFLSFQMFSRPSVSSCAGGIIQKAWLCCCLVVSDSL